MMARYRLEQVTEPRGVNARDTSGTVAGYVIDVKG